VDGTLKEATRHVVDSHGKSSRRDGGEGIGRSKRRPESAGTRMDAGGGSSIKLATRRQAESSRGAGDREVDGKGTTVQGISAKRDDRVKVEKHRKTKNSIDSDVGAQGEGKSNRRAALC
jgi:hypothetical protein